MEEDSYSLVDFLKHYSDYSKILCPWRHFNANGQVKKTQGNAMDRFTQEVEWYKFDGFGKFFAQTCDISGYLCTNPVLITKNSKVLTPKDRFLSKYFRLNHYYTRSYEEYCRKIARGTDVPYFHRSMKDFFDLNPDLLYLYDGNNITQVYGSSKV